MTLDQAKVFFHSMGCSAFHMSREDPGTYRQYLALGISKEIERTWAIEAVESAISKLLQPDSAPDDLWAVHTQASETIISDRLTELLLRCARFLDQQVIPEAHEDAKLPALQR